MKKFLFVAFVIVLSYFFITSLSTIQADDITSSVTVGNAAPFFDTDGTCGDFPCESPARYTESPVNVGTSTTFRATADEPNGEQYYLIVCKTNVFNENNSGAPTCDTGATICVSSATNDGSPATCNYQAQQGDNEQQVWYAKVCDANTTDQMCSETSQGDTGEPEASPLEVNHAPTITQVSNDAGSGSPNDPGTNVTWTTTASDPDTTRGDTVSLFVCSTNSFSGSACGGTELCSDTNKSSNPSCQYQIPAGTDDDASPYSAYAFIVDNWQFDPSVSNSSPYYVANVAPSILSIETNGGNTISLTGGELSTTNISFVVSIQDNNGCNDLESPTSRVMYRSSVSGGNSCSGNVNNCYTGGSGAYAVTCNSNSTCTGGTDVDVTYTCTAAMQYHADPTVANTPWEDDTWLSYFAIADDDAESDNDTAVGVELDMLQALDADNLSYGNMSVGTYDATLTDSNTIYNTGNTGLNARVSSSAPMTDGNDHYIAVNNQRADPTSGTAWASAEVIISGSLQTVTILAAKTTVSASPVEDAIYWGINIPSNTFPGLYTGSTTVAAIYSASGW